jgi:hypothetical protein
LRLSTKPKVKNEKKPPTVNSQRANGRRRTAVVASAFMQSPHYLMVGQFWHKGNGISKATDPAKAARQERRNTPTDLGGNG